MSTPTANPRHSRTSTPPPSTRASPSSANAPGPGKVPDIRWLEVGEVICRIGELALYERKPRERVDNDAVAFGDASEATAAGEVGKQEPVGDRELDGELGQQRGDVPAAVLEVDERKQGVVAAEGWMVFGDGSRERAEGGNSRQPRRGRVPAGPSRQVAQLEVEAEMPGELQPGAGPMAAKLPSPNAPPTRPYTRPPVSAASWCCAATGPAVRTKRDVRRQQRRSPRAGSHR